MDSDEMTRRVISVHFMALCIIMAEAIHRLNAEVNARLHGTGTKQPENVSAL